MKSIAMRTASFVLLALGLGFSIHAITGNYFSLHRLFGTKVTPVEKESLEDNFQMVDSNNDISEPIENKVHSLVLPGNWVKSSAEEIEARFGMFAYNANKNDRGIRSHEVYFPGHVDSSQKPMVITVVHGTWAEKAQDYFSAEKQFYSSIAQFAQQQAEHKHTPVEIISFRWTGFNQSIARTSPAKALASVFTNWFSQHEIITIAHSHGCNLVNNVSRYLPDTVCIDHIINLAAPVRDTTDQDFKPLHFKKLTQFYSTSDLVAAVGSLTPAGVFGREGSIRKYSLQAGRRVVNVRTQINGKDPSHSAVKLILPHLSTILDNLNSYVFNHDFDLEVTLSSATAPVLLAVRGNYVNAQELQKVAVAEDQKQAVARQFAYEYTQSEWAKKLFAQRYGRTLSAKSFCITRLFNGIAAEVSAQINKI